MPRTRGSRLLRYGFAFVAVALASALRLLLDPLLREQAPYTAYFLAIALTAWYSELGPSLVALAASAGVSTYLFTQPRGSFLGHGIENQSALALFLFAGAVVALLSNLQGAGRRRAEGSVVSLKDSESQLLGLVEEIEKVMEVAPAAILIALDPACQRITGNRAANELYGVRGKINFSLTPPLGEEPVRHRYFSGGKELHGGELPMQCAAAQNKEIRDLEMQVFREDGAQLTFFGGAIPLHDEHGRVRGCIAAFVDITARRKAEQSLRKLSQAVEQSPVNVIITDTDGNIEYVNRRFCQVTGYSPAEAVGKNPRILKSGHTSDEEYRTLWQTITAGGEWSGEFLNKAKDGKLFWEKALITSIKDEAGHITHFLAVKEDITERKQAEEALQQERVFTNAVLDSVPGIPYLFDAEGRLVRWNKKQEEMTGYSAAELVHMHITDWFRGEDVSHIAASMAKVFRDGYADAEATLVAKDGTGIPFYFTGVRLILDGKPYLAGMGIDVSKRKKAEESLRKLSQAVEQSPVNVIITDPDGNIEYVNRRFMPSHGLYARQKCWGRTRASSSQGTPRMKNIDRSGRRSRPEANGPGNS